MTQEQAIARIAELEAQLARRNQPAAEIMLSPKGYVMFKPKGHKGWPVTASASAWLEAFKRQGDIVAFIQQHAQEMALRGAK